MFLKASRFSRSIFRILSLMALLAVTALAIASCSDPGSAGKLTGTPAGSPTDGYKKLYSAVKSKDTEAIKAAMTQKSLDFAGTVAAQQKKEIAEVLANGFTATTFAERLPQIRDERIEGEMGAVEVWNEKDKRWEDLPFIFENGEWKLAIGDLWANTFRSPGKGRAQKEAEAANVLNGNTMQPLQANINGNFQSAPRPAPREK